MRNAQIVLRSLVRAEEGIVVLIDHQPGKFSDLIRREPTMVIKDIVGFAP
jgi:hypothetical protein